MSGTMPAPSRIARISRNKGVPAVELTIGDAQVGTFVFFLWESDGKTQQVPSGSPAPSQFSLNPPVTSAASLDRRLLTWQGLVGAPAAGSELFSVTVNVTQDGISVPDGPFVQNGSFEDVTFVHDGVTFALVD